MYPEKQHKHRRRATMVMIHPDSSTQPIHVLYILVTLNHKLPQAPYRIEGNFCQCIFLYNFKFSVRIKFQSFHFLIFQVLQAKDMHWANSNFLIHSTRLFHHGGDDRQLLYIFTGTSGAPLRLQIHHRKLLQTVYRTAEFFRVAKFLCFRGKSWTFYLCSDVYDTNYF